MNKIICFDIDDCILPHYNMLPKKHRLQIFKLNLERLVHLCQQTGAKLFMTSSWGMILKLDNGYLTFKDEFDYGDEFEQEVVEIMNSYLQPYIIGVSCGDRREDIKILLLQENTLIVAIDDMDLSDIERDNFKYIKVETMITDRQLRYIKKNLNKIIIKD